MINSYDKGDNHRNDHIYALRSIINFQKQTGISVELQKDYIRQYGIYEY